MVVLFAKSRYRHPALCTSTKLGVDTTRWARYDRCSIDFLYGGTSEYNITSSVCSFRPAELHDGYNGC